jgi:hypothetical protein
MTQQGFLRIWGELTTYAFPSFSIISRCLTKGKTEEARL